MTQFVRSTRMACAHTKNRTKKQDESHSAWTDVRKLTLRAKKPCMLHYVFVRAFGNSCAHVCVCAFVLLPFVFFLWLCLSSAMRASVLHIHLSQLMFVCVTHVHQMPQRNIVLHVSIVYFFYVLHYVWQSCYQSLHDKHTHSIMIDIASMSSRILAIQHPLHTHFQPPCEHETRTLHASRYLFGLLLLSIIS